jgi:hypothetical protein
MKNSYRLIKFLKSFFSILLKFAKFAFVVNCILIIVNICGDGKEGRNGFSYFYLSPKTEIVNTVNTNTCSSFLLQQIGNEVKIVKRDANNLDTFYIADVSLIGRILGSVNMFVFSLFSVLLLNELCKIFSFLYLSIENKKWFSKENYRSLRKIGFYTIGYYVMSAVVALLHYWKISVELPKNELVGIYPYLEFPIITIAIVFVIAELSKAGFNMQEEQEFTV